MEKTKKVVGEFMNQAGRHDTTVHESTAPAVEHKTIKPTQHEQINTAVDQEVHQDHYHRTVQPVQATEVMPEQHTSKVAGTVHREFDHRDNEGTERAMRAEAGKLRNERHVEGTTHTQSRAPVVQGEHVHHHVHETVQPLVQKEVIQPEVIHTTVPIHEVHHQAAQIHSTTEMPAMSMDEFKKKGGNLGGQAERTSSFEGCPQGKEVHPEHDHTMKTANAGSGSSAGMSSSSTAGGASGSAAGSKGLQTEEKKQPSLLDRMNPYKDT
ncbi:hypothetical protein B0T18DRAFT_331564 [Schizothecium vesticola]|uniref:Allergen n=1 Tax=Schizothecium vesticola TaxID=314040 RepID=A0AA40JYY2_9PEZI|nr:hypothetical protein B0T18DRAFT_331564 [Schizothecium vesticola]